MCKHFQIWLLFEIEDICLHKAKGICIGDSEDLLLSAKEGIPWIRTICFQQPVFVFAIRICICFNSLYLYFVIYLYLFRTGRHISWEKVLRWTYLVRWLCVIAYLVWWLAFSRMVCNICSVMFCAEVIITFYDIRQHFLPQQCDGMDAKIKSTVSSLSSRSSTWSSLSSTFPSWWPWWSSRCKVCHLVKPFLACHLVIIVIIIISFIIIAIIVMMVIHIVIMVNIMV